MVHFQTLWRTTKVGALKDPGPVADCSRASKVQPPSPPRHPFRPWLETLLPALSQLAWAHLKAVGAIRLCRSLSLSLVLAARRPPRPNFGVRSCTCRGA